jgi:peptidoglycan/LPS O-acetylase OafA/YrhL
MVDRIPRHYPCLDGLRGLAILLVIPHNADIVAPVLHGPFKLLTVFIDRGWVGVELFFVLSGFLITEQLYKSRAASNYFGGFYARRVLRIVPLFIAAVVLALVLTRVLASRGQSIAETPAWVLWLGIFIVNWTQPFGLGIPGFPQFWSLALEEQFYLIWPVVVREFASRLLALAVGIAVVALGARILMLSLGASSDMVYMWTVSRMDAIAFGAISALIVQRWRVRNEVPPALPWVTSGVIVALIGALLSRLYAGATWTTQTVGFSCLGLACMLILLGAVANDLSPRQTRLLTILRSRLLASVGRYSYGMYVFHMFFAIFAATWIKRIATSFGDGRMLACALLTIALSYGMGFLSYHLYEKHFLRFGGRHFAPRQPYQAT